MEKPLNSLSKASVIDAPEGLVRTCSIWRALNIVGDVPTLLILQAIWMQKTRFGQMAEFTRLPRAVLSDRLSRLIEAELLSRDTSLGQSPYHLAAKGLDLFPIVLMLLRWEKTWSLEASSLEISLIHQTCGHIMQPKLACGSCGGDVQGKDVLFERGPGFGLANPIYQRRRHSKAKLTNSNAPYLFTQSADILGDRWSALVLRSVFTGFLQFEQIREDLAIATNILSDRLEWLQSIQMLAADGDYQLTEKGIDFVPVLSMLQTWGDKHCSAPEGPPVLQRHTVCGESLNPIVLCDRCGKPVNTNNTELNISYPS